MAKSKTIGFWLLASPVIIGSLALAVYAANSSVTRSFFASHPSNGFDRYGNPVVIDYDIPISVERALLMQAVATNALLGNGAWLFFALWFGLFFLVKAERSIND